MEFREPPRIDFRVKYRFLSKEEGGRETGTPFNGYRSDWLYIGDDPKVDGINMIWPFFEDSAGNYIKPEIRVPEKGIACMYIVNTESRKNIHCQRIRVGVQGFFVEGSRKIAEAEVIEIIDLHE